MEPTPSKRYAEADAYHSRAMARVATTPAPAGQKYPPGTRVRIADDLGPSMRHFIAGKLATVHHTYAHAYGGTDVGHYFLDIDGYGRSGWYLEHQLSPATHDREGEK